MQASINTAAELRRQAKGSPPTTAPGVFTKTLDYLNTIGRLGHMDKPKAKIPVAILVRVSTAKQETARQISELQAYTDSKAYEVIEVCEETISGQADECERHG